VKVDVILNSAEPGGSQHQGVRLSQELQRRGHDVTVVFFRGYGPLTDMLDASGTPWRAIRRSPTKVRGATLPRTRKAVELGWQLARFPGGGVPDIVYARTHFCLCLTRWMRPYHRAKVPVVAGVVDSVRESDLLDRIFARELNRASGVICNTDHLRILVLTAYGADPDCVRVVPNGVDLPVHLAEVSAEPPVGVVVANFVPYKGHEVLMQALARMPDPPHVRLCGTGTHRQAIMDLARRLDLQNVVHFVAPPAAIADELRSAQFAVHPSLTEGLSNAILEEMAAGLPVIACSVGGNKTLVTHGQNGLIVPPGDAIALAHAIGTMRDAAVRQRMGPLSRERAQAFSWRQCVLGYERAFENFLAQAP
jgi:glycosyltransferase involved in cell wall biosynthesis